MFLYNSINFSNAIIKLDLYSFLPRAVYFNFNGLITKPIHS